jgi:large subunit ribosomal protein L24
MKFKKGDNVVVIAGKHSKNKNNTGKILRILPKSNRVVVDGLNKVTRHVKKSKDKAGQKVEFEAPMHASNVMLIDPKTKKRSRIGYSKDKDNKKLRISKASKTTL